MMRKLLISLAVAASALAVASPASAQYYPQPQQHYPQPPQPQGYGWGNSSYGGQHGQVRQLQNRVQQIRQRIGQLQRVNRLSWREARRLDSHAVELHRRIDVAARRGLNPRERRDIQRRTEALRHAVRYEARDGNRWGWNGYQTFDNAFGYYGTRHADDNRRRDRRDDWDDRWERDRDDD